MTPGAPMFVERRSRIELVDRGVGVQEAGQLLVDGIDDLLARQAGDPEVSDLLVGAEAFGLGQGQRVDLPPLDDDIPSLLAGRDDRQGDAGPCGAADVRDPRAGSPSTAMIRSRASMPASRAEAPWNT